jgi:hypothetical protein
MQSSFDDACINGLLISLQPHPTSLIIYAHNPTPRLNSVYRANKTHLWRSEPAFEKIDNIKYEIARHQMVGFALIEIYVPNSAGIKV